MKLRFIAACCAALSLGACASSSPEKVLDALGRNYAHCERTVTYSAAVGPLNPTSGAFISGSVRCPPAASSDIAAPGAVVGGPADQVADVP